MPRSSDVTPRSEQQSTPNIQVSSIIFSQNTNTQYFLPRLLLIVLEGSHNADRKIAPPPMQAHPSTKKSANTRKMYSLRFGIWYILCDLLNGHRCSKWWFSHCLHEVCAFSNRGLPGSLLRSEHVASFSFSFLINLYLRVEA